MARQKVKPVAERDLFLNRSLLQNLNSSIPWFLMASYLYYEMDISLLSDTKFDALCSFMLERWDTLDHPHKYLISEDDLRAGTGFGIERYPIRVQQAALAQAELWGLLNGQT